ncbi:MAG: 1-deoxy-D-xylulose-5-phosphate reductoisomerase [Candidatus Omnitrophota bacterium]
MKDIILLGSTGSVGKSVLEVVRNYPKKFRIKALFANKNVDCLVEQAREFNPDIAVIGDKALCEELKERLGGSIEVTAGKDELIRLSGEEKADIVFMAISGLSALKPLVASVSNGRTIALASKEPIVSAGRLIKRLMAEHGSVILPVDSEHSAIADCIGNEPLEHIRTLYITGSGGSLNGRDKKEFDSIGIEEVLAHPKWNMGPKITVDSATLMNKGLEVIEARWLFDVPQEKIKVVIQPEAVIHSMVEFIDGRVVAGMFYPDMRFPILRALAYPDIIPSSFPRLDFEKIKGLTFQKPDIDKFPALELAYKALKQDGIFPAVLNSANETAVKLFLDNKIRFVDIIPRIEEVLERCENIDDPSIEDIIAAENWAKEEVLKFCLPG